LYNLSDQKNIHFHVVWDDWAWEENFFHKYYLYNWNDYFKNFQKSKYYSCLKILDILVYPGTLHDYVVPVYWEILDCQKFYEEDLKYFNYLQNT
jgi:hypothetical protein